MMKTENAVGLAALVTAMMADLRSTEGISEWRFVDCSTMEIVLDGYSRTGRTPVREAVQYTLDRGSSLSGEVVCDYLSFGQYGDRRRFGVILSLDGLQKLVRVMARRATAEYEGTLEVLSDDKLERRLAALES